MSNGRRDVPTRALLKRGLLAVMACAMLLPGCGTSPVARHYMLSAVHEPPPGAGAAIIGNKVIGLGPVVLPEYLDRPQIVTRSSHNRLEFADVHRWAEPLVENVANVLSENLRVQLGMERILLHPWAQSRRVDYQVTVQVLQFEQVSGGAVRLEARWSVLDKDGAMLLPVRRSSIVVDSSGAGYDALVADQSQVLARFSREIAAGLRGLP